MFQNEEIGEEFANEEVGEEFVNEEVGEEVVQERNTEDWQLVPDTDGNLHMVNIREISSDVTPSFVPGDIVFRLFTRQNPTAATTVPFNNNAVLNSSNYNPALQTRFHIHGTINFSEKMETFSDLQTLIYSIRMEWWWRSNWSRN